MIARILPTIQSWVFCASIGLSCFSSICLSQEPNEFPKSGLKLPLLQVKELIKETDSKFAKEFQVDLAGRVFMEGLCSVPIELGELLVSKEHEVLIEIPELADSDISIAGVQSSCGCVTAEPYEPETRGRLKILLRIKGIGEEQQFGKAVNVALLNRSRSGEEKVCEFRFEVVAYFRAAFSFRRERLVAYLQHATQKENGMLGWEFCGNIAKGAKYSRIWAEIHDGPPELAVHMRPKSDYEYFVGVHFPKASFRHGDTLHVSVFGEALDGSVLIGKVPMVFIDDYNVKTYPTTIIAQEYDGKQTAVFRIVLPKNLERKQSNWRFLLGGKQLTEQEVEVVELRERILKVTLDLTRISPAKHELEIEFQLRKLVIDSVNEEDEETIRINSTVIVPERPKE